MRRIHFLIVSLILLSFAGLCFADTQDVSITTYYPPPYSVYDALRLPDNNTPPDCNAIEHVGTMHYDDGFGGLSDGVGLYMCIPDGGGGFVFKPVPLSAAGVISWEFLDRSANSDVLHIFNDNDWAVGIGTNLPGFGSGSIHDGVRLHIADPNNVIPFAYKSFSTIGTSTVLEGRDAAVLQVVSEYDSTLMASVVLSANNITGNFERHWFINAWGPDTDNRFAIGMGVQDDDDTDDFLPNIVLGAQADQFEYMNLYTSNTFSIFDQTNRAYHGALDVGWEEITGLVDTVNDGEAESKAICPNEKRPLLGGCDSWGRPSTRVKKSYPVYNDAGWGGSGWHCECFYDGALGPNMNCQAYAYCANITQESPP